MLGKAWFEVVQGTNVEKCGDTTKTQHGEWKFIALLDRVDFFKGLAMLCLDRHIYIY